MGRKSRPVCVVVRTATTPARLFLLPVTSQNPGADRPHLATSEIECRRGGLDFPSYLIFDEYNFVQGDEAYDLESPKPIGSFSPAYLRKIAIQLKEISAQIRIRAVARR
ncbi:hypothetical protein [Methylocystis parvus]|nr:hypothetical protein [Methylocystis parvus]WBK00888.1 hypothetical protein MMG94_03980 [Methylocystis parvus OBBP]